MIEATETPSKTLNTIQLLKSNLDHDEMMRMLKKNLDEFPHKGKDTFLNTPVLVSKDYVESTTLLCNILNTVLQKIVENYFVDQRIREIYNLDSKLEAVLNIASKIPYKVGFYRPDFIYSKDDGQPKICEIGCRYPLNGWMLSFYLNNVVQKLNSQNKDETNFLAAFSSNLKKGEPLYLVHDKEKGTEVHYLLKELNSIGFESYTIHPKDIVLENGKLKVNGKPASQFILEMDREELKVFDSNILKKIIEETCINDVRTLILVYDKRVLSVMYDEEIMSDYISKESYHFLKKYLIPSFTLDTLEKRNTFLSSNNNWVLKNNSGGRGIGMYIKNDCDSQTWKHTITKEWKKYMIQEFVEQETFQLGYKKKNQDIYIVGMLLCYNGTSFGPGIFRGSSENIINLHQGRGVVLPCLITS